LTRASTSYFSMATKNVDGRVKPGHDVVGHGFMAPCALV
jgi:hypothetical protein